MPFQDSSLLIKVPQPEMLDCHDSERVTIQSMATIQPMTLACPMPPLRPLQVAHMVLVGEIVFSASARGERERATGEIEAIYSNSSRPEHRRHLTPLQKVNLLSVAVSGLFTLLVLATIATQMMKVTQAQPSVELTMRVSWGG